MLTFTNVHSIIELSKEQTNKGDKTMYYGYHRTSTADQHLDRGITEIETFCKNNNIALEKIYTDQQTGKNFNRPRYQVLKEDILRNYSDLLISKDKTLFDVVNMISEDNVHIISFRTPTWRSTPELTLLSCLLKDLNTNLKAIKTRTFLSITPKVEDLKVVYNWIKKYNVPHYYVQVFFDKAYGISFKKILQLIGNPDLEGKDYFIESDIKNQNKTTIKIHANKEANILEKISLPEHFSDMKELGRGRVLFYVKFKNSVSTINYCGFKELFGIDLNG